MFYMMNDDTFNVYDESVINQHPSVVTPMDLHMGTYGCLITINISKGMFCV